MPFNTKHPVIVIYGVSGCGKTTIGKLVSEKLMLPFYDADDFHPPSNVDKMRNGMALTDTERRPWLRTLASRIAIWKHKGGAVLACSALKEHYRRMLATQAEYMYWVLLSGSFKLIKSRLEARRGHFMSTALLQSQFDTLEIPDYGIKIDIENTPEHIADAIIEKLNRVKRD